MGVCERGGNERPRSAETPPKTKTTEIMGRLEKTMLANTCRRLRSRIGRVMEAAVNLMGRTGCRYTKEHVCKISRQFIHFHRSYGSFCNVRTFVLIYRPHPVHLPIQWDGRQDPGRMTGNAAFVFSRYCTAYCLAEALMIWPEFFAVGFSIKAFQNTYIPNHRSVTRCCLQSQCKKSDFHPFLCTYLHGQTKKCYFVNYL